MGPGIAATGKLAHTLGVTSLWWFAPPLWLCVMDPRVVQAVKADPERINLQPGQREVLMQRLGLAGA